MLLVATARENELDGVTSGFEVDFVLGEDVGFDAVVS